jgi:hypothetical protein
VDWISWLQGVALVVLNNLVLGFWKPWASAYAGEKAKTLARKEDLDKILAEVRAVTVATKEIEAKISGELWDRQMHWTQKRDVYGDMARNVNELMDAYIEWHSKFKAECGAELLSQASHRLRLGYEEYFRSCAVARIFASAECNMAIEGYRAGRSPVPNPPTMHWAEGEIWLLKTLLNNIIVAAKADLGIVQT